MSNNMRFIMLTSVVGFFTFLPVYVLNTLVMPELNGLQQTYAHMGQTATDIASH